MTNDMWLARGFPNKILFFLFLLEDNLVTYLSVHVVIKNKHLSLIVAIIRNPVTQATQGLLDNYREKKKTFQHF